jgi:hypothetical protein
LQRAWRLLDGANRMTNVIDAPIVTRLSLNPERMGDGNAS